MLVDRQGTPLALKVTGAHRQDCTVFTSMVEAIPPINGRYGRPDKLHADKAYDHRFCRVYRRERGIKGRIARRGIESSEHLGRHRSRGGPYAGVALIDSVGWPSATNATSTSTKLSYNSATF